MNFLELARRRVSVRGYRPDPVSEELLNQILEAARLAPSAANRQPLRLIVIRGPAQRAALAKAYPREWFAQAPLILALCVDPAAAWHRSDGKSYADVDAAIMMDHVILCAADLGLGTCWIGAFDPALVRQTLDIPGHFEPIALTPVGYPLDAGRPKTRKSLDELVSFDRF